jgi:hypothetical protein
MVRQQLCDCRCSSPWMQRSLPRVCCAVSCLLRRHPFQLSIAVMDTDPAAREFAETLLWKLFVDLEAPEFLSEMVWNTCGHTLRSWQAIGWSCFR